MKRINYCLFFCLFLLLACTSSRKKQENVLAGDVSTPKEVAYPLTIDLEAALDNQLPDIKLSSLVEDITYIPLKTEDADFFMRILLGLEYDEHSHLFVLNDPFYAFTVDTLGHFVNRVGRIGQGPGEYKQIGNISVNFKEEQIFIQTAYKHNVITYDYQGHVIAESSPMSIDAFTESIFYYDDALWGVGIPYTSRALKVKKENRRFYGYALLDSLCKRTSLQTANAIEPFGDMEGLEAFFTPPMLSVYKDIILLAQNGGAPSDTIYTIQNKLFVPRYFLNYGSHRPDLTEIWSKDRDRAIYNSYITLTPPFENERLFFIELMFQDERSIICYDKLKNETFSVAMSYLGQTKGIENDIDGGFPFYPRSVSSDGTYWLTYLSPADMKECLTEEYFAAHSEVLNKKKQEELKSIVANADEEDNPVLVLLKIKK